MAIENGKVVEESMRAEEKKSYSWVVDMKKLLESTDPCILRFKKPSIYKVPEWIKHKTKREAYEPQVVSLGPFHHGKADLVPMEKHKTQAVLRMVHQTDKTLDAFVSAIEKVIDELVSAYDNPTKDWRVEERGLFVEMMVKDGCFLLEMMKTTPQIMNGEEVEGYAPNDPVFSWHGLHCFLDHIRSDMVVMENQLPLRVLQRLEAVRRGTSPSAKEMNKMVLDFLERPHKGTINNLGLHPLDLLHQSYCGPRPGREKMLHMERTMPSAVELREAGIHFKRSDTSSVSDVHFKHGVLSMPFVTVHESTEKLFLNMMAFERLHPDAGHDVTSYIFFMDNIINVGTDVALLKSKGVIEHTFGSDEEVAKLFNTMNKGAEMSPFSKLHDVQRKVNMHYSNKGKRWLAMFEHAYMTNPWVFISLVVAVILVVATLVQTVYTVLPYYTK